MCTNIKLLQKIYREKKNKSIAVFLGAGVTVPLGIKNWIGLLKDMNKFFEAGIDVKDSLDNKKYSYQKIASLIYDSRNDADLYKKFMKTNVVPRNGYCAPIYPLLYSFFDHVFTTNYDESLYMSFEDLDNLVKMRRGTPKLFKKCVLPKFHTSQIQSRPHVVYLHGYKDENIYILREKV